MKNYAALFVLLAVTCASALNAQTDMRRITVSGHGQVDVEPDMATITLGVTQDAREARQAMDLVSRSVAQILERLSFEGIEARDIQTRGLRLNPVWSNRGSSGAVPPKITGFVASNTVFVRVRDLPELGGILDAVIEDGANEFNGLRFSVQEPDPLADKARQLAVADAMAKAQLLADAAGVALGPVVSITEQGGNPSPVMMEMANARGMDVPIASGEVSVQASVSMMFEIGG